MRFHLIDRVDAYEPGQSVRARKLTSKSETLWEDTPSGPVMAPPLVLEALCQAGTWLVMITTERKKRAALLSIGDVSFVGDVVPGDILILEGAVESMGDEVAAWSATSPSRIVCPTRVSPGTSRRRAASASPPRSRPSRTPPSPRGRTNLTSGAWRWA